MLSEYVARVGQGIDLDDTGCRQVVVALTDESVPPVAKAEFLTALARKGETAAEIAGFAGELRARAIAPPVDPEWRAGREILDVCGTGGDRLNTFNISTTVALVCAAAGVPVAKHGNRAITSQSGSADVLEALGIPIQLTPEAAARALMERGFAFLFAPAYHPAFKHIAPARKLCAERGQRTIFNILGPLLNPARPSAQLIGVSRPELVVPVARSLQAMGVRRGMVACGTVLPDCRRDGVTDAVFLDELSTLGGNTCAEFYQDRGFHTGSWRPEGLPLQPAMLEDLAGGDREQNARIVLEIVEGRDRGPRRDAVQLNAGAALFVADHVRSIAEGWERAGELFDSGAVKRKLGELRIAG